MEIGWLGECMNVRGNKYQGAEEGCISRISCSVILGKMSLL